MEQDLATLQIISETLKEEPQASQRTLAKNANMSLGMMNAILGRFVERGWIMLTNVNGRKLAYAVTEEGVKIIAERKLSEARERFRFISNFYSELEKLLSEEKSKGKSKVYLFGNSSIKFILENILTKLGLEFYEKEINTIENASNDESGVFILSEQIEFATINEDIKKVCHSLIDLI